MNHPDDDRLLQVLLQTDGGSDSLDVQQHLLQCAECRERERKMRAQIERLGSVRMEIDVPHLPRLPRTTGAIVRRWGWAAGLAAGFLLGMLTASLEGERHLVVTPQRLETTPRLGSSSEFTPCQAVDVKTIFKP